MPQTSDHQPIVALPDLDVLPKAVRADAAAWQELADRLDDLDMEAADSPGRIAAAIEADKQATRQAVLDDADLPPEHAQEAAARTRARDVERRRTETAELLRQSGRHLRSLLRAHRDEIATAARPRIETAMANYTTAMGQAAATLAAAGAQLATATGVLGFLRQLDEARTDVGPDTVPIPQPQLSDARENLQRVRALLPVLDTMSPAAVFEMRRQDGLSGGTVSASTAYGLLVSGGELANPDDLPRLMQALGTDVPPTPAKPPARREPVRLR